MADYWVKSGGTWSENPGGTGNGPATAGTSYEDITAAFTAGAGQGDRILVSDLHSVTYGANQTWAAGAKGTAPPLVIISVDDADATVYKLGAAEDAGAAADINITGFLKVLGVDPTLGDDLSVTYNQAMLSDMNIAFAAGGRLIAEGDNTFLRMENVEINFGGTTCNIRTSSGARFEWVGGGIAAAGSAPTVLFDSSLGSSGGSILELSHLDLSNCTDIFSAVSAATVADTIDSTFRNCIMPTGWTLPAPTNPQQKFDFWGCDDGAGNEYGFAVVRWGGYAIDETTIVRNESQNLPDGSTKLTAKIVTDANCGPHNPFVFEVPAQWADLSDATTDNVKVFIASTTALTDQDVIVDVFYPDGTTATQSNWATSSPTVTGSKRDPMASGTTLTDDSASSTWKDGASDLVGYNEYSINVDTTGDVALANPALAPVVRLTVTKASVTIYLDTEVEYWSG